MRLRPLNDKHMSGSYGMIRVSFSTKISEQDILAIKKIETADMEIMCEVELEHCFSDRNVYKLRSNKPMGIYLMGMNAGKLLSKYGVK